MHAQRMKEFELRTNTLKTALGKLATTTGLNCDQLRDIEQTVMMIKAMSKRMQAMLKNEHVIDCVLTYQEWTWFEQEWKRQAEKMEDKHGNNSQMLDLVFGLNKMHDHLDEWALDFEIVYRPAMVERILELIKS